MKKLFFFFSWFFYIFSDLAVFQVHDEAHTDWKDSVHSVLKQDISQFSYYFFVPRKNYDQFSSYFAKKKRKIFVIAYPENELIQTFFQIVKKIPKDQKGVILSTETVFSHNYSLRRFRDKQAEQKITISSFLDVSTLDRCSPLRHFVVGYKMNTKNLVFGLPVNLLQSITWKDVFRYQVLKSDDNSTLVQFLLSRRTAYVKLNEPLFFAKKTPRWVFGHSKVNNDNAEPPDTVDVVIDSSNAFLLDYRLSTLFTKLGSIHHVFVFYDVKNDLEKKCYDTLREKYPRCVFKKKKCKNFREVQQYCSPYVFYFRDRILWTDSLDLVAIADFLRESGMHEGYVTHDEDVKKTFLLQEGFFTFDKKFRSIAVMAHSKYYSVQDFFSQSKPQDEFSLLLHVKGLKKMVLPEDQNHDVLYTDEELNTLFLKRWSLSVGDEGLDRVTIYPKFEDTSGAGKISS